MLFRSPPPSPRADHGQRRRHRRQRERDDVALRMIPDEGDTKEERVGRERPDGHDDTERGKSTGGRHVRILPRTPVSFERSASCRRV